MPDHKSNDLSKLKIFAKDSRNMIQMTGFFFKGHNHWNREECLLPAFKRHFVRQCIQKPNWNYKNLESLDKGYLDFH